MKIFNTNGTEVVLNEQEARLASINQKFVNDLGYEIPIDTMTTIMKKITEQKFFEIAPADYMPIKVGEGAWSQYLTTYRSFALADSFDTGIINLGAGNSRLATGDAGVDALTVKVNNWAKSLDWTLFDLQSAAKAGNWDLVTAKERSRKKNWDLGVQRVAFLGLDNDTNCHGLLNQTGITSDIATITKSISSMTGGELKTFCSLVLGSYRTNCNRTAYPTHFIIPESDYLGLAAPSSADFPLKSVLAVLEETFQVMTKRPDFKILPCSYCDAAYNNIGHQRYVLLNYDEESIRMDIPVDYTSTVANSINNFAFQNVAYGQFTGVVAYRPLELLYLDY